MLGMNPEPMASYSLADRFICDQCDRTPSIKAVDGRDPMTVTFVCHGQTEMRSFSKADLVFTQIVFKKES